MAKKQKKSAPPDESGSWLTTFADMMTLLLTFFVLLFAMSTLDPVKMEQFANSVGEQKGSGPKEKKVSLSQIKVEVNKLVKEKDLQEQVKVTMTSRGVTMGVASEFAFSPGSANLKPEMHDLLREMVETMKKATYSIAVEGHTDNDPIQSPIYPSNWELSGARASAVINYLITQGVSADKFRAIGFADTRPVVPNDSNANKAKNRRVDVTFLTLG